MSWGQVIAYGVRHAAQISDAGRAVNDGTGTWGDFAWSWLPGAEVIEGPRQAAPVAGAAAGMAPAARAAQPAIPAGALVTVPVLGTTEQARVWRHAVPARRRLEQLASQRMDENPYLWLAAATYGVPYVYGGISLQGMDCSGIVQWGWVVMERAGLLKSNLHPTMPRRASLQAEAYRRVPWAKVQPGDLIFYVRPNGAVRHATISLTAWGEDWMQLGANGGNQSTEANDPDAYVKIVGRDYWASARGFAVRPA